MSSQSWTTEDDSENRSSSERPQASPSFCSPSPPLEWSSDSKDRVPLAQRRVAGEAPVGRRPAAAGRAPSRGRQARASTSSRVGAESPKGAVSTVTSQDLANIQARYQIPWDVGLYLPTPDD